MLTWWKSWRRRNSCLRTSWPPGCSCTAWPLSPEYGTGHTLPDMGLDTAALDNSPPNELLHDHHPDCADPPLGSGVCGHYLEEQFQISLLLCNENKFFGFIYIRKMKTDAVAAPPLSLLVVQVHSSLFQLNIYLTEIFIFFWNREAIIY